LIDLAPDQDGATEERHEAGAEDGDPPPDPADPGRTGSFLEAGKLSGVEFVFHGSRLAVPDSITVSPA
jgi:hypothetical protein